MKGIDILILKGFDIIYVKSMVGKWYDILVIYIDNKNARKYLCKQEHKFP